MRDIHTKSADEDGGIAAYLLLSWYRFQDLLAARIWQHVNAYGLIGKREGAHYRLRVVFQDEAVGLAIHLVGPKGRVFQEVLVQVVVSALKRLTRVYQLTCEQSECAVVSQEAH